MKRVDSEDNGELSNLVKDLDEMYRKRQAYLVEYYPTDIPNKVCNHAFIKGIKFENSFKPKEYDFVPLMKCGDEELFVWTHTKDTYTALVSRVSDNVKDKNFWKNIGTVIQLAYSYSRDFEHTIDMEYKWCYYFDSNKSISEQEIYDCSDYDRHSLLNGNIIKLTDLSYISPIIELLLRDDKAYTALSNFFSSMKTHYCCLICELDRFPYKKHTSHEPKSWEQANVISEYEAAILQACRCVEALIGKPPNKESRNRFLEHKKKWINQIGINPDDIFTKGETTYIDFYYKLFSLRNAAAHSYGTIPFEVERKQAVYAQCFASLLLDGYVAKNVLSEEIVIGKLGINQKLIEKVDETMSTPKTYQ
ncbi:hypothetical protein [Sutcliffiella rhizosphaerae]|uniref:Apea-like HEPN domain-containing protein n=1 Tax=Sutcliffiella rhizosphaerae TaxID=2880967 RepID=A0ABM8YPJ6_9BACI|nr:hypothetical protein [Sutcliffiella rhizosphaerae]CAG9621921.1 hypothetical protein BACCIP111883_02712 [Sutcliffiella rhizosphaerae]